MSYRVGDWLTADLPSFGVICCRNSLRCSTKANWRRSLLRFHDLLVPGGVLILETHNALGIQEEVEVSVSYTHLDVYKRQLPATFRPRDVVVLLDRSGSMSGWKMAAARRAAARLIDTLTDRDRFGLILFDNELEEPAPRCV